MQTDRQLLPISGLSQPFQAKVQSQKPRINRIAVGLIVDAEAGRGWWIDPIYVRSKSIWKQATTGSGGTAGEIAVSGMTVAGIVIVTAAEDPGSNLAISDAICSSGKITVYATSGSARSALSGKKINYLVLSL